MAAGIGLTERMRGRKAIWASTSRSAQRSREEVAWLRGSKQKQQVSGSAEGHMGQPIPLCMCMGRPTNAVAALGSATFLLCREREQLLLLHHCQAARRKP